MDRRSFLLSSAAALGAGSRMLASPNDTVRIACVGIGGRGKDHISGYSKLPNVEIAAICDVDDAHIAKGLKQLETLGKNKPATYKDLRKLLEYKNTDAIALATRILASAQEHAWEPEGAAGPDAYPPPMGALICRDEPLAA